MKSVAVKQIFGALSQIVNTLERESSSVKKTRKLKTVISSSATHGAKVDIKDLRLQLLTLENYIVQLEASIEELELEIELRDSKTIFSDEQISSAILEELDNLDSTSEILQRVHYCWGGQSFDELNIANKKALSRLLVEYLVTSKHISRGILTPWVDWEK